MKTMVLLLLLISGCATTQLPDSSGTLPVLLYQVPLPSTDRATYWGELRIDLKLRIAKDSSVQDVIFLSSNTDPQWEVSAKKEIQKWRFLPATQNGVPVPVWIRQSIVIRSEKPLTLPLSKIVFTNYGGADSIYTLLKMGEDFESLARKVSPVPPFEHYGKVNEVNIRTFPFPIQRELEKLNAGEFTTPLQLGHSFIIFKRLTPEKTD
jgi:hypothetical protein